MKKLLLLIMSVLAFTGISLAQDVYTVGCKTVSGVYTAALFKNGSIVTSLNPPTTGQSQGEQVHIKGGIPDWAVNWTDGAT